MHQTHVPCTSLCSWLRWTKCTIAHLVNWTLPLHFGHDLKWWKRSDKEHFCKARIFQKHSRHTNSDTLLYSEVPAFQDAWKEVESDVQWTRLVRYSQTGPWPASRGIAGTHWHIEVKARMDTYIEILLSSRSLWDTDESWQRKYKAKTGASKGKISKTCPWKLNQSFSATSWKHQLPGSTHYNILEVLSSGSRNNL